MATLRNSWKSMRPISVVVTGLEKPEPVPADDFLRTTLLSVNAFSRKGSVRRLRRSLMDSNSTSAISLGSDHRTVKASLRLHVGKTCEPTKSKPKGKTIGDRCISQPDSYTEALTTRLQAIAMDHALDERCRQIEEALIESDQI